MLVEIISIGVVLSACFILRWIRHPIMRWICPSEILYLESTEERNRICDHGYFAFLKHTSTWKRGFYYILGIFVLSLGVAGLTIAETRGGKWSGAGVKGAAILCVVIPLCLIPLMCMQYRNWMRVFLRQFLNDHGIPICRNCGYDLRGLSSVACPECGATGKD